MRVGTSDFRFALRSGMPAPTEVHRPLEPARAGFDPQASHEGSSNGKSPDSGPGDRGSSPRPSVPCCEIAKREGSGLLSRRPQVRVLFSQSHAVRGRRGEATGCDPVEGGASPSVQIFFGGASREIKLGPTHARASTTRDSRGQPNIHRSVGSRDPATGSWSNGHDLRLIRGERAFDSRRAELHPEAQRDEQRSYKPTVVGAIPTRMIRAAEA